MIHTSSYSVEVKLSGTWTAINANDVISTQSSLSISGNSTNPLAPGDDSDAGATVVIRRAAATFAWLHTPIRITYTMDGTTAKAFVGIITARSGDAATRTFTCRGISELVRTKKLHSDLLTGHPIASATSITSIDDPANPLYRGGGINWILWQCGGRPYEQAASYPSATFYYSCNASVLDCPRIWVAGDDSWAEAQKLCQASGGRLYQDEQGIVRYRSPLRLNTVTAGLTLTDGDFEDISEEESADQVVATMIVPYTRRYLLHEQEVFVDETPRLIPQVAEDPNNYVEFTVVPRWPVDEYTKFTFVVATQMGTPVYNEAGGYTYYTDAKAQLVTIAVWNLTDAPIVLHKVTAQGTPLVAGEGSSVRVGSGTPERNNPENEFIQDERHAERLGRLLLDLYAATPTRAISGAVYTGSLALADVIGVTDPDLGLSNTSHLVVSRDDDEGETTNLTVVSVAHLPAWGDTFLFDATYADADVKKLGY